MARYIDADAYEERLADKNIYFPALYRNELIDMPTADVAPKSEVLNEIEALGKKVGQIYNHYVFEDTDYADDDVAIEAVINALTEVLNELAELKNKYTEGEE